MSQQHQRIIAKELRIPIAQVAATVNLLADGATVPFISRYRKEATGSLDEVQVTAIRNRLAVLAELDTRRLSIIESLAARELLSGELHASLCKADNLASLEDIYLPYKPKRRTRAMIAREKGLEPLARALFARHTDNVDAAAYVLSLIHI